MLGGRQRKKISFLRLPRSEVGGHKRGSFGPVSPPSLLRLEFLGCFAQKRNNALYCYFRQCTYFNSFQPKGEAMKALCRSVAASIWRRRTISGSQARQGRPFANRPPPKKKKSRRSLKILHKKSVDKAFEFLKISSGPFNGHPKKIPFWGSSHDPPPPQFWLCCQTHHCRQTGCRGKEKVLLPTSLKTSRILGQTLTERKGVSVLS